MKFAFGLPSLPLLSSAVLSSTLDFSSDVDNYLKLYRCVHLLIYPCDIHK